jgi:A/G-specific adenine glycosylase
MLQQTQVATVIPYYERWLRRFPNVDRLARASESDVLHAWQGLGYYSRARNIHRAAKIIRKKYGGIFPTGVEAIVTLPGVGRYTTNAIATFAFDRSVPIVEANIARLMARIFNLRTPIDSAKGRATLWRIAEAMLPKRRAHAHNSALIDLGATVCIARAPKCGICPVKTFCRASNPALLPIKKTRPATKHIEENHAFITRPNEILLQRANNRWRGMWILPPLKVDGFKPSSLPAQAIHVSVFPFTHHRVTLRVFRGRAQNPLDLRQRWVPISKLDGFPIPTPHRRALSHLVPAA